MKIIYIFGVILLTLSLQSQDIHKDINKCKKNDMFACARVAKAYKEGLHGLVPNSIKELQYNKKSCLLGFRVNCEKIPITKKSNDYMDIASTYGMRIGQYGYKILKKMCNADNAEACYYLSTQHDGRNTEKDKILSKQYYQKAKILKEEYCANNDAKSCEWLYHQYERKHQKTEAAQYLQQATTLYKIDCDNKVKGSCLDYELCRKIK